MYSKINWRIILTGLFSISAGVIIFFIDSSPGWDDSGITAGLLFITSAVAGIILPRPFWLWALLVGFFIPVNAIIRHGDFMFLLLFLITLAGSFSGAMLRKALKKG